MLTDLLGRFTWLFVLGIFKYFVLPLPVILLLLLAVRYVVHRIAEGDFHIRIGGVQTLARRLSSSSGWHQTWWGMLIINAAGSVLWALIARIF